jgi:hypothetical protein
MNKIKNSLRIRLFIKNPFNIIFSCTSMIQISISKDVVPEFSM